MTSDVAPRGRRGWWQFSLFSLLLLFVIACLIAGYVGQSRRMEEARRELARRDETIKRLRQELGIDEDAESALTVVDPAKVHVVALPSFEEEAWRWKIYLPPGKKWAIGIESRHAESAGEPLSLGGGSTSTINDDGELLLEARLLRDLKGFPQVKVRLARAGAAHGSVYLDALFKSKGRVQVQQAGRPKQVVFPANQRVEILRRTVLFPPPGDAAGPPGASHEQGVIAIYLAEWVPPAAAAKKLRESFPK